MTEAERQAFDLLADLLEDQGFPWHDDRVKNREAIKHAFIEAHRRGFRIQITTVPPLKVKRVL